MIKRREFLRSSSLLSLTPLVPAFVNQLAHATSAETDQKILVIVELSGGNDGINTVVPFADEAYTKNRPTLKLNVDDLHRLNDDVALNPSMRDAREMFDQGALAIVQGVGYPNPNRSHFESMAIWHAADLSGQRKNGTGWIGQALDVSRDPRQIGMDGYFVGTQSIPGAIVGRRAQVAALSRFVDMRLDPLVQPMKPGNPRDDIAAFVNRQKAAAITTSEQIEAISSDKANATSFPDTALAQKMKLVSQLIQSGSAARVYYAVQGGYDTHSTQRYTHGRLLAELSSAVKSFFDDLKRHGLADRVVLLAFSEFGRRVRENGSQGTDHGTAGPVFLFGPQVQAGLVGDPPDLSDPLDGDIKSQFDFRQIYSTLLDNWLEISSQALFDQSFEPLPVV